MRKPHKDDPTDVCKDQFKHGFSVNLEIRSPSVPLEVVFQYLAGAFLNLLKWWIVAEMPYSPERMYEMFQ